MKINASNRLVLADFDCLKIYKDQKSSLSTAINSFLASKGLKKVFANDIRKRISSSTIAAYGESYAYTILEDYSGLSMGNALADSLEKLLEKRNYTNVNDLVYLKKDAQEHIFELDADSELGKLLRAKGKHLYFIFGISSGDLEHYLKLNHIMLTWRIDLVED